MYIILYCYITIMTYLPDSDTYELRTFANRKIIRIFLIQLNNASDLRPSDIYYQPNSGGTKQISRLECQVLRLLRLKLLWFSSEPGSNPEPPNRTVSSGSSSARKAEPNSGSVRSSGCPIIFRTGPD